MIFIGQARLSAFAAKERTGSRASRSARRTPRNAESFSSWSVMEGSMWKEKRLSSASTASADAISARAVIASCRS